MSQRSGNRTERRRVAAAMSDMNDDGGSKHGAARDVAEAALRAEPAGDTDRADGLMEQAEKTDPAAVIDVATERPAAELPDQGADDAPLSAEAVVPGSDAPSRAGITGTGSGADGQGL